MTDFDSNCRTRTVAQFAIESEAGGASGPQMLEIG